MACFPPPGSITLCEINRALVTTESYTDTRSYEVYGKVLGLVFDPIPFQSDTLLPNFEKELEDESGDGVRIASESPFVSRGLQYLQRVFNNFFERGFSPKNVHFLSKVFLQGVSWNQHNHILAYISGPNQVSVRDFENSESREPSILTSETQRGVRAIEWRPNGGKTLSVACKGGICIWSASYPGNVAPLRSGVASFLGNPARGSGIRWALVDFLKSPGGEQVTALSWTSASSESSSFIIWDVAQGTGTPIRRGLGGISLLKWSPTGDYFFTTKFDGTFYLWETNTWTSEPWSSSGSFVIDSSWDPDGRMILVAFSDSTTLGSIHFASKPPSLDAHLLPVDLPEIVSVTGSTSVEMIAWDTSGERLAVSYKDADKMYAGLIAVYDIRRTPLVSASLIGFIRGPGERPRPLAFSFHNKFKQGPLLSVCWSCGWCCTYPLIFRSHSL
ncbi:hypothetical protein AMTRI_Chr01g103280 [Amborella trichopoda]